MAKHGRKAHIEIDNLAGVLTNVTRKATSINTEKDVETEEATAFEATNKEWVLGFKDSKGTIEGNADDESAAVFFDICGESEPTGGDEGEGFDIAWGPDGNAAGKRKYSGKVYVTKYSEAVNAKGVNKFTAEIQFITDVARGAYA